MKSAPYRGDPNGVAGLYITNERSLRDEGGLLLAAVSTLVSTVSAIQGCQKESDCTDLSVAGTIAVQSKLFAKRALARTIDPSNKRTRSTRVWVAVK